MANNCMLDVNATTGGKVEPVRYEDSAGEDLCFRGAAVRHYGSDLGELYQVDEDGNIYEVETDDDEDNEEPIPFLYQSKRHPLGAVCLIHSVFLRLEGVSDSLTLTVTTGGAEYAQRSREYTISLAGTDDKEIKQRIDRDMKGRWVQIQLAGDVSNRPAIREIRVVYVPLRSGRIQA